MVCAIFLPEETLEEFLRRLMFLVHIGLMENCLWCEKLNCSMIEKCTHNFKSMGKVWKWGCFDFSLTFMKCSFPHDEILLGPIWLNLVHEVISAESRRVLSRIPFYRSTPQHLPLSRPFHPFYLSLLHFPPQPWRELHHTFNLFRFFPFEASTPREKFLYSCLLANSME